MDEISLKFFRDLKYLHLAAIFCQHICQTLIDEKKITKRFARDLDLALSEACTNAFKHGGLESGDEVFLTFHLYPTKIEVLVKDQGEGFDVDQIPPPDFEACLEHGYGIYIMKTKTDRVESFRDENNWTVLKLIKHFDIEGESRQ